MSIGLTIFTLVHVGLSLLGIASGFVLVYEFLAVKRRDVWTAIFLSTTVLTSVTGFFFPVEHFMPSHALGIVSLLVLGVAIVAPGRSGTSFGRPEICKTPASPRTANAHRNAPERAS